jgi:hypothetical protein
MMFANQQAYDDYVAQYGAAAATGGNSPRGLLGGGDIRQPQTVTPNQRFLDQYGSYGFAPELQNYLAQQAQMATTDAGIAYQYDPATQTFTGQGFGTGPITLSMAEMMQRAGVATPRDYGYGNQAPPGSMAAQNPLFTVPAQNIMDYPSDPYTVDAFPPMSPSLGSAPQPAQQPMMPKPTAPLFSPLNYNQQQQPGMSNTQFAPMFSPLSYYQQPNFANPFAMRPFFNQLGMNTIAGVQY